ncbi:MAG: glycosyltransferase family 2 protein [Bacteroidales bacterium]|jgi:GT2 family glycosyltransferase|nr:glycosyltransferase family 2 protein [Bacteroidales bacterium]MCI1785886.1 glycosyltransferase family 2 protein [Bacteroidales bacterium]
MKTAIVILNWNTESYLERFLPPLLASAGKDAEVIVADSASEDNSMDMMAEKFPSVKCIRLDRNYGFAGGYNRALAKIDAEYFILINSDVEVPAGWLGPLTAAMDSNPEIGVCGPKLLSYHERDKFEYAGAAGGFLDRFGYPFCRGRVLRMTEKDTGQYESSADVFWISGACLMVRSGVFRSAGGFDERFFAHMEEIDLCWRIQLQGYRIRIIPDSYVWHVGGGTLPNDSPWKLQLNYRNNLLMLENNLAKTYAVELSAGTGMNQERNTGKTASKACRKARCTIGLRMILDGISALIYLLSFKSAYFKAVMEAHSQYRKMRKKPEPEEVAAFICSHKSLQIKGFYTKWIIPEAIFRKAKVFESVHKIKA